jgi:hypothetical protein
MQQAPLWPVCLLLYQSVFTSLEVSRPCDINQARGQSTGREALTGPNMGGPNMGESEPRPSQRLPLGGPS